MEYENLNKIYVSGIWRDGKSDYIVNVLNPFDNELIYQIKGANQEDLNEAYESAKIAQKEWAKRLPSERSAIVGKVADLIEQRKDEISKIMMKECGSTFIKQQVEISSTVSICREAATFPTRMHGYIYDSYTLGKESRVYRKPLGVIGVISPFNFPLSLSMRSVATAIAIGNSVVLKPAKDTPLVGGMLIAKLFEEAGLPAGVLNVIAGNTTEIGDSFSSHLIPNMISYTGSTAVGIGIGKIAAEGLKKTALELGGNNVFIVLKDADIDRAVSAALFGKFLHQGQICMAINRILLQEEIAKEFTHKFIEKVKGLKYGNPADKEVVIGPVIHDRAANRILKLIEDSVAEGAKIEVGGTKEGRVISPTVITNVTNESAIVKNEIFGPVAPIIIFKDEDEMLDIANSIEYGLSGAIHTSDINHGVQLAKKIETGMIHINDQTVNEEPNAPFGGVKFSGLGRFNGSFILEEFSTVQWVTVQQEPRDYGPFG
ncbi:aldehyde dehydrogenase [Elizabethkingia anophelis]|nr:aldehyde dehydrogenase [Elizabethkingia anophelis]MDV3842083.1 aldehyde dehydrogenase [Elizabethkingia anophelis]